MNLNYSRRTCTVRADPMTIFDFVNAWQGRALLILLHKAVRRESDKLRAVFKEYDLQPWRDLRNVHLPVDPKVAPVTVGNIEPECGVREFDRGGGRFSVEL